MYGQGEANFWYFGQNAGLNFNTNPPTAINGSINTNEGCASFSDKEGNLLFYTDGTRVYNKDHMTMPNGFNLRGNPSSTQSGIIVPHPGNPNQYYIFTVGANFEGGVPGLNSYIVDMTENGGLGDVVSGPIDLSKGEASNWTEKVTSVKGADCKTFWVISLVKNIYYVFKLDENGLDETPIKSPVPYHSTDRRGYLKVSPDGKKVASANFNYTTDQNGVGQTGIGRLHLYDFNDKTGEITNEQNLINFTENDGEPYGVEFSPNSSKLYCSTYDGTFNKLWQYDLNNSDIKDSKILIKNQAGYRGGMQLAPNGKIYVTVPPSYFNGTEFLDVINSPDELGNDCDYKTDALFLGSGRAMQGLPPFIASLLLPIEITSVAHQNESITNQTIKLCVGSEYTFKSENLPGTPDYSWSHNGIEISKETSLELTDLDLSDAGSYQLVVNVIDDCGFDITYEGHFEVEVYFPPTVSKTYSYEQCDIDEDSTDGITLFNLKTKTEEITGGDTELDVVYYESPSDLDMNISIPNPENYISGTKLLYFNLVNINSGCFSSGELQLNSYPTSLDTYENYYVCENLSQESTEYRSIGNGTGTFDLEIKRSEILSIFADPSIEVEFFLNSDDAQLQTNAQTDVSVLQPGIMYVRISNALTNDCISVGTFELVVNPLPKPMGDENPQILCVSNPRGNPQPNFLSLNGATGSAGDSYQWYLNDNLIPGATMSTYDAHEQGTYKVITTSTYLNNLSSSNDDSYCEGYNSFTVIESNPPYLDYQNIQVIDDSTNNTISIDTSNLGLGEYEFALDTEQGFYDFQSDPVFENIEPGVHTLYAQDINGCGLFEIEVSVIGYPKFFTPNNDGINDTWIVKGVNEEFYSSSIIYVFDRFGKLITMVDAMQYGWDGSLNGKLLPSTDYWFRAELVKRDGTVRIKTGHFSMIRQ